MKIFVDSESKIRAVDNTNDSTLTPIELDPNEHTFDGWSSAKICCYQVSVSNGFITMMTPYVDSRLLDMIDNMGHQIDAQTPYSKTQLAYIGDTAIDFMNAPKGNISVFFVDEAGNVPKYQLLDLGDRIRITFDALEHITTITLVISQIKEEQR